MKPEDKEKTAFSTPDGHYQFTVMPFGVCNGPSAFQRLMGAVLKGLQWQTCLVYLDDIIVFGRTFPEHLDRLKAIFARLRAANLRLKPSKCFLFREKVNFLGHVVTADGVQTDPAKIRDIEQWPTIRTVGQLRTFLGFSGYYRRFVRDYASIAKPLHALTHKGVTFQWTSTCEEAFNKLRQTLVEATTLAYPRFGPGDPPFVLDADASGVGLGAVLSQPDKDGKERPIAFASRFLNSAERRYGSTKCELLGMVWAVKHFRCYLLGREFLIRTDHRALQHWGRFKDPPAIIARWLEFLAEFQFSVQYRQGRAHANADGLSRCKEKPEVVAAVATTTPVIPSPFVQRRDWSHTNWAQAQSEDGDISQMGKWLAESAEDPDLNGTSPALHAYWRGRQLFLVKEGVVYRRWLNAETLESRLQILVPTKLRPEVLIEYHDMAGHAGVRRTYEQLHRRFYWHGMKRDVQDWVASCVSCSEKNRPVGRGRGASLQSSWAGYPFERIAMDLIPGLPETQNGNKHILVVVDYFSKWVEAYPLKRMDALTIASVFVSEFVARFGAPERLHTDQGRNFDSTLFKEVCSLLGIRKTRTTAYHPASDGLVERFNQTLEVQLSHYVDDTQRDWDTQLPAMLMAYRATPQTSTGYTPAYLLFGRELCLPNDVAYGVPPMTRMDESSTYVKDLRQRLNHAHSVVRKKLGVVHQHQAHLYDSGAVMVGFEPGDLVWLLVPAVHVGTTPKLARLWKGPHQVQDKLSDVVYRIVGTVGDKTRRQVVHVNRLKRCFVRPERLLPVVEEDTEPTGTLPDGPGTTDTRADGYVPDATDRLYETDLASNLAESFCDNGPACSSPPSDRPPAGTSQDERLENAPVVSGLPHEGLWSEPSHNEITPDGDGRPRRSLRRPAYLKDYV